MEMGLGRLTAAGSALALGAVVAVGFAGHAVAVEDGETAKGLGKDAEWINGPPITDFEKLRGRVIFVDLWGIN